MGERRLFRWELGVHPACVGRGYSCHGSQAWLFVFDPTFSTQLLVGCLTLIGPSPGEDPKKVTHLIREIVLQPEDISSSFSTTLRLLNQVWVAAMCHDVPASQLVGMDLKDHGIGSADLCSDQGR